MVDSQLNISARDDPNGAFLRRGDAFLRRPVHGKKLQVASIDGAQTTILAAPMRHLNRHDISYDQYVTAVYNRRFLA